MSDRDNEPPDERAHALARLATLQRMREQALKAHREAMLRSIEQLITQESKALRQLQEHGPDPRDPHDTQT